LNNIYFQIIQGILKARRDLVSIGVLFLFKGIKRAAYLLSLLEIRGLGGRLGNTPIFLHPASAVGCATALTRAFDHPAKRLF
jgi:hypothetical protein